MVLMVFVREWHVSQTLARFSHSVQGRAAKDVNPTSQATQPFAIAVRRIICVNFGWKNLWHHIYALLWVLKGEQWLVHDLPRKRIVYHKFPSRWMTWEYQLVDSGAVLVPSQWNFSLRHHPTLCVDLLGLKSAWSQFQNSCEPFEVSDVVLFHFYLSGVMCTWHFDAFWAEQLF